MPVGVGRRVLVEVTALAGLVEVTALAGLVVDGGEVPWRVVGSAPAVYRLE